ncbi:MAG: hypothetical protein ACC742_13345, partial [Thermoanaerobaculales bacterium]
LVWTDPPSNSSARTNLVNDLDLKVTGPDGAFLGNIFDGGVSVLGGAGDRLNNVEVVWLPAASAGNWTVEVGPHAIREGRQDFALVVTVAPVGPEPPTIIRRPSGRRAPG